MLLVVLTFPALRSEKEIWTVSPISTAPLVKPGVPLVKYSKINEVELGTMLTKGAATRVKAVAVLFVRIGSASPPETEAVDETVAALVTRTTLVRLTLAPGARVPALQVTTLPEKELLPWLDPVETRIELVGRT